MLWDKTTYTADISYLTNVFIYEYDISKANINILFTKGVINEATYKFLYEAQRMVRQVYVGKLCKDTKVSNILKNYESIQKLDISNEERGKLFVDIISAKKC